MLAAIREAVQAKRPFELEHRVRRVDGSLGWTSSRAIPLLGPDGELIEWFGTATDITARKEAEAALRVSQSRVHRRAAGQRRPGCRLPGGPPAGVAGVDPAEVKLAQEVAERMRAAVERARPEAASRPALQTQSSL